MLILIGSVVVDAIGNTETNERGLRLLEFK